MKKRIFTLSLALIMCLSLVSMTVFAAEPESLLDPGIDIRINGEVRQPVNANGEPVYPILYNGTIYVPVRGISYLLGKAIEWESSTRTILLTDNPVTAPTLKLAEKLAPKTLTDVSPDMRITIKYNGVTKQLTDANGEPIYPIQYGGMTYVPVRSVSNLFGKTVNWNGETRTILITDNMGVMRDITAAELVAEIKVGTNHYRAFGDIDWQRKEGYLADPLPNNSYSKFVDLTLKGEGVVDFIPSELIGKKRDDGSGGMVEFYTLEKFTRVIQDFKDAGYDAVRLPVSWTSWTNDKTFAIDKEFIDLVEKAVKIILDKDMYCIINTHDDYLDWSWVGDHWDRDWMAPEYKTYVDARYTAIWKQIAERFKNYGDYLLFESFNEPCSGDQDNMYGIERTNELQAAFVKTVRESGGNNAKRFLALTNYHPARVVDNLQYLQLPKDDRIIVQVHHYASSGTPGTPVTSWSSNKDSDTKEVDALFSAIKQFKDKTGVPVILGEFANSESMPESNRIDHATYVVKEASALGVPVFWWENTINTAIDKKNGGAFSLYNRDKMGWEHPKILKAIMNATNVAP